MYHPSAHSNEMPKRGRCEGEWIGILNWCLLQSSVEWSSAIDQTFSSYQKGQWAICLKELSWSPFWEFLCEPGWRGKRTVWPVAVNDPPSWQTLSVEGLLPGDIESVCGNGRVAVQRRAGCFPSLPCWSPREFLRSHPSLPLTHCHLLGPQRVKCSFIRPIYNQGGKIPLFVLRSPFFMSHRPSPHLTCFHKPSGTQQSWRAEWRWSREHIRSQVAPGGKSNPFYLQPPLASVFCGFGDIVHSRALLCCLMRSRLLQKQDVCRIAHSNGVSLEIKWLAPLNLPAFATRNETAIKAFWEVGNETSCNYYRK